MTASTRPRLRSEISRGCSVGNPNEGTSARTRPFSYDEIMHGRKTKDFEGSKGEAQKVEHIGGEETVKNLDHDSRDANSAARKHSRNHGQDGRSKRKEEKTYKVQDFHDKSKTKGGEDVENQSKHKHGKDMRTNAESLKADRQGHVSDKYKVKSLDMDSRSTPKHEKDVRNNTEPTEALKANKGGHVSGKFDEEFLDLGSRSKHQHEKDVRNNTDASNNDRRRHASGRIDEVTDDMNARSKYRHEKAVKNSSATFKSDWRGHARGKLVEESYDAKSESKHKQEKDVGSDTKELSSARRGHVRSKQDERLRDVDKYDYENKHHRDFLTQDRNLERSEGALEREKKRKDCAGDDEKVRRRDPVTKHDSGRRLDSVISERKEKMELSHPHNNEIRSKRRRSRSQERSKGKGRRSRSTSPQVQKRILSDEHDHGQLASNSHKDRSRHHSDADRSKMSGNGSADHHRRHNGSSSGLGGYSPRKRKTEAAVKIPSPIRSPERKSGRWDLPHSGTDINLSASAKSGSQLVSQSMPSNMIELATGSSVASSFGKPLSTMFFQSLPTFKVEASVDSVQLTQSTRPMRRLYIDNIPASASEKDIMECFNTFLLSSGSNHIRGKRPCISCMIHKEKEQALLEFLTPEDASAALSFDGKSLYGRSVKIRRPKDYVDMARSAERSKAAVDRKSATDDVAVSQVVKDEAISHVVKDSPNKIFVGGIAEGLSSEMIMEIVSAFGQLKAFHFDINEDLNEPCAFLEYADQSITLKACAGLNGMKLGGRVLIVTQAFPNTSSEETTASQPFYGIPEHVRHLLETPTQVLKLSNVLNQKLMESLPDTEVEEILDDVRLECSRFGTVVSTNVVKSSHMLAAISKENEVVDDVIILPPRGEGEFYDHHLHSDFVKVAKKYDGAECGEGEPLATVQDCDMVVSVEGEKHNLPTATAGGSVEGEAGATDTADELIEADNSVLPNCEVEAGNDSESVAIGNSAIESTAKTNDADVVLQESIQESVVPSVMELTENIVKLGDEGTYDADDLQQMVKANDKLQEATSISDACGSEKPDAAENNAKNDMASNIGNIFVVGCVFVEFRRTEAACLAAHCLHGRLFSDRIVSVEYVPLEAYQGRFLK